MKLPRFITRVLLTCMLLSLSTFCLSLGEHAVIVGTIGNSRLIDELIANGKLDVSETIGEWDGFMLQLVTEPFSGVELALVGRCPYTASSRALCAGKYLQATSTQNTIPGYFS